MDLTPTNVEEVGKASAVKLATPKDISTSALGPSATERVHQTSPIFSLPIPEAPKKTNVAVGKAQPILVSADFAARNRILSRSAIGRMAKSAPTLASWER